MPKRKLTCLFWKPQRQFHLDLRSIRGVDVIYAETESVDIGDAMPVQQDCEPYIKCIVIMVAGCDKRVLEYKNTAPDQTSAAVALHQMGVTPLFDALP